MNLHCKIFGKDNIELLDFPVTHFDEHIYNELYTFSCVTVLEEDIITDSFLEQFNVLFNKTITMIQMVKDDTIIAQYTKYTNAPENAMINGDGDYLECVITFHQNR